MGRQKKVVRVEFPDNLGLSGAASSDALIRFLFVDRMGGVILLPDPLPSLVRVGEALELLNSDEQQIVIRLFGLDGGRCRLIKQIALEAGLLYGNIRPLIASSKAKLRRSCLAEGVTSK